LSFCFIATEYVYQNMPYSSIGARRQNRVTVCTSAQDRNSCLRFDPYWFNFHPLSQVTEQLFMLQLFNKQSIDYFDGFILLQSQGFRLLMPRFTGVCHAQDSLLKASKKQL